MSLNLTFDDFKPLVPALETAGLPILSKVIEVAVGMIPVAGPFVSMLVAPALSALLPTINTSLGIDPETPPDQTAAKILSDPEDAQSKLAAVQEQHSWLLDTMKEANDSALKMQQQQVDVNTVEAQNPSMFVAGWRPAMGWGFGGVVLVAFVMPYVTWFLQNFGLHLSDFPKADPQAIDILVALLGLTTLTRSFDKLKGTASNDIGGTTKVLQKTVKLAKP